jgi:hypothetical protein
VSPRKDGVQPWPVQFLPETLFYGESSSDLPALMVPGTTNSFVLIVQGATKDTTTANARVQFSNPGISAKVTKYLPNASAVPGQTDGGGTQGFIMDVTIDESAASGPMTVRVLNPAEGANPTAAEHPWETGLAIVPG